MKRLLVAALLLVVALALLVGLLWSRRVEVTQVVLDRALAANLGVPIEVRVERVERDGLALSELRVGGDGGLRMETLELAYGWAGLWRGSLDAIHISGVRVSARVNEDATLDFGPLAPLVSSEGDGAAPAPLVLPAPRVLIEDVVLELETPRGPVHIEASADFQQSPGADTPAGNASGEIRVNAVHEEIGGEASLSLSGPLEGLRGKLSLRPRVGLPGLVVEGEPEITGEIDLGGEGPSGTLEIPALPVRYRADAVSVEARTPPSRCGSDPSPASPAST